MLQRTLLVILVVAALGSAWLMYRVSEPERTAETGPFHEPDYYMEDFTSLSMREDGSPRYRLEALYMAHYRDNDTSELLQPYLQVFRTNNSPLHINADRGWVVSDNEIILLRGDVTLWQNDAEGERELEVTTSEVRVLTEEEYAETDNYATINTERSTISGTGMRAYFKDSRLRVIDHERTTIEQAESP